MEIKTRIKISLNTREIEWEGSESFIEKYQSLIEEIINKVIDQSAPSDSQSSSQFKSSDDREINFNKTGQNESLILTESFGEFYIRFSKNISVSDKLLIAGFFVQSQGEEGSFSPKEAADLLNEQSVKVTNASAFIKSLQNSGKVYKQGGRYKVHEKAIEYIKQLVSQ
jgi:hypothetical protein